MHPRHSRRRSYATVLLVCLLLVGRLSAELHLASVRHVVCAQHGELVEVGAHGHAGAASAGGEETTEHAEGVRVGTRPAHDDHDHCAVAQLERERALGLDLVRGVAHAPERRAAPLDPSRAAPTSSIPRFLLAPKQSPPTAS